MSVESRQLRADRKKLTEQARALIDKAHEEGREGLSGEDETTWKKLMADQAQLKDRITELETLEEAEKELEGLKERKTEPDRPARHQLGGDGARAQDPYELLWRKGTEQENRLSFAPKTREHARAQPQYEQAFGAFLSGATGHEQLAPLQSDDKTEGGYLVPMNFVMRLIQAVDDMVLMRRLGTVIPVTSGDSLGVPSLDTDPGDADWTGEITAVSEDTAMKFGKRELTPHALSKLIKVSRKLLRTAALNPEQIVRQRLAYKFGITEEKAYLTGSGSDEPLGIFTASASGISTGRDVRTGSTTNFTYGGLVAAKYQLKTQYRGRARWLFHRDAVELIAKLEDSQNRPLWYVSTREGEPDTLLGLPVEESEYVPSTFTADLYVGMLADFSWYWIADSLAMEIQRLEELYAATNQIGLLGRKETDGMPVLEEAFARLQTDAS